jgi:hypothetical protein
VKVGDTVKVKQGNSHYIGEIIDFDLYTGDPVLSTNIGIRCPKAKYCKVERGVSLIKYMIFMVTVLILTMLVFAGAMSVVFNYGVL